MIIFLLSDPSYPFLGFVGCASIIVQIRLFHQYLSLTSDYATVGKKEMKTYDMMRRFIRM